MLLVLNKEDYIMSDLKYKAIIGLEIHVHLNTKTKMFCSCPLEYGGEPNTCVCPVCLGMPGVLPVMNKKAYEYAVLAALALNCNIPRYTKWDRKSYYYPDLPKNYQISQYDLPMSEHGYIEIPTKEGDVKKIRITRAHLEEDAGKNTHSGSFSQVDLNRAGTPLLEIVTEPDLSNGFEVRELAVQLQRIVRYLGVSQADMQKGHMRFEPNVNLHISRGGEKYKTPISEIKNLNSFKALELSVEYEIKRQLGEFVENGITMETGQKTTRGWDADREVTVHQRSKEAANDYRYFPDPDLVPVELDDEWFGDIKSRMCELPLARERRFVSEYGLSEYDAGVLTAERDMADYFEDAVRGGADPKRLCNILTQTGFKLAKDAGKSFIELGVPAAAMAKLCVMTDEGTINATAASTILEKMATDGGEPEELAGQLNLVQKSDAGELEGIVDAVLSENTKAVEDVLSGGKKSGKARGFLMGQVMQKTKGQANPKVVNDILTEKLRIKN
jgi:aspartyl-tRNA(Asn)/glutamyl-tRNA(Gln) amidotransferase subunit B